MSLGSYGCAPAVLFERRAGPAGLVAGRLFLFLGATRVLFTCALAPLMPSASVCWAGVGSSEGTGGGGSIGTEPNHKVAPPSPLPIRPSPSFDGPGDKGVRESNAQWRGYNAHATLAWLRTLRDAVASAAHSAY